MSDRQAMTAILHVFRTGCSWKKLPRHLGAASTVHDRFQEWRAAGVFARMQQSGLLEDATTLPLQTSTLTSGGTSLSDRQLSATAATSPWSVRMADAIMAQRPILNEQWNYDWGVLLTGIEQVWLRTRDQKYFAYIQSNIDHFVRSDGTIRTYSLKEYNIDRINTGRLLFPLYAQTGDERYKKALFLLRQQLLTHPRTSEGGFWHKQIYPHQMWLDGVYMFGPFLAQFAKTFDEPAAFDDVTHEIILMEKHARDPQTGLLYHGWDESRQQRWADPQTGCSPHFWGRAIGWYVMAIVDVLDHLPLNHAHRPDVVAIFKRTIEAVIRVQDQTTGLWYQVLDQGARPGNYLEASGSCMFVYAIAKAVQQGILAPTYLDVARKGYQGILNHLIRLDDHGWPHLEKNCLVAGLGGNPYRDGSYTYYIGEPVVTDDNKGVGAFILASIVMEDINQR